MRRSQAIDDAIMLREHVLRETHSESEAMAAVAMFFSSFRRGRVERRPAGTILRAVCEVTGVSLVELLGQRGMARIASARHVAAYLLIANGYSFPEAAKVLRRKGHFAIRNSCERVEKSDELQGVVAAVSRMVLETVGEPSRRTPVILPAKESVT